MNTRVRYRALLCVTGLGVALACASPANAQGARDSVRRPHVRGEVLVQFRAGVTEAGARSVAEAGAGRIERRITWRPRPNSRLNRLYRLSLRAGESTRDALSRLSKHPLVEHVQPNFVYRADATPDDTRFAEQWALSNTGQASGSTDADIGAPEAWDLILSNIADGEPVVVAVIDTGVDYLHVDLSANMWVNGGEIAGNGTDDDGNGYVDDVYGYDFAGGDGDPMDEHGHGTHVAGTVAAVSNNTEGVAGVAGDLGLVRVMAVRFLGSGGGTTADAIDAIGYAVLNGARVLNNSWGGGAYDSFLLSAITDARLSGAVFVAASGNDGYDNDNVPHYPSSYEAQNIISVASTDHHDELSNFSNYGATSVDMAAPGSKILSTAWGGGYEVMSGTSMAAPHVAGAAGLAYAMGGAIWPAEWPEWDPEQKCDAVVALVVGQTEGARCYPGPTVTSGRLSMRRMFASFDTSGDVTAPGDVTDLQRVVVGADGASFSFTAPGDDGASERAYRFELRGCPASAWASYADAPVLSSGAMAVDGGATQYVVARDLEPGTAYAAQLAAYDDVYHVSYSAVLWFTTGGQRVQLLADDFESGMSNWSGDWGTTSSLSRSPSHSAADTPSGDYEGNEQYDLESGAIALQAATRRTLKFHHQHEIEYDYDYALVQVLDGPGDPHTVDWYDGGLYEWAGLWLDVSGFGDSFSLRFQLNTDAFVEYDGWYIDDVIVEQVVPSAGPVLTALVEDDFGAAGGWTSSAFLGMGNDWAVSGGVLADSPSGSYADDAFAEMRRAAVDLSGCTRAELQFTITSAFASGDYVWVEASADGVNWSTLWLYAGSYAAQTARFSLSAWAGVPELRLRFVVKTNDSGTDAGCDVDDLRVLTDHAGNQPPVADSQSVNTDEDVPLPVTLAASDLNGDELTYVIVEGPTHGTLSGTAPDLLYTPEGEYSGADSFTFTANDGEWDSNPGTVFVGIALVDDPPVAVDDAYGTDEDVGLTITAPGVLDNDSDVDSAPLAASVVDDVVHGTLSLDTDGGFTYTPEADYHGDDFFTYIVTSGGVDSSPATVTITMDSVDDAPTADDQSLSTDEDTALAVTLTGDDVDGDALSFSILVGPSNGTVSGVPPDMTYTPATDYHGPDSFTFKATAAGVDSAEATISLTVDPVNDAPYAVADEYQTLEDVPLNVVAAGVLSNDGDVEGDSIESVVEALPLHGVLSLSADGSFDYTPASNWNGSDSFSYRASDTQAVSLPVTVTLTVDAVPDEPLAVDDDGSGFITDEDTPVDLADVLLNDSDPDAADVLVVSAFDDTGTQGVLGDNGDGTFSYDPVGAFEHLAAGEWATDEFTYTASDLAGATDVAVVTVTISGVNDTPVAFGDVASTDEETAITITGALANDTDVDFTDTLTVYSFFTNDAWGVVSDNGDGSFGYDPGAAFQYLAAGEQATEMFSYTVSDGNGGFSAATVTITIDGVNDAPVTSDDAAVANEATPIALAELLSNDVDPDASDSLEVTGVDLTGTLGWASLGADGTVTYGPNGAFDYLEDGTTATDTFRYEVADSSGATSVAVVTITIMGISDPADGCAPRPGRTSPGASVFLALLILLCRRRARSSIPAR